MIFEKDPPGLLKGLIHIDYDITRAYGSSLAASQKQQSSLLTGLYASRKLWI